MPDLRNQSTINLIAQRFCDNGRKQEQALIDAGYSKGYARSNCGQAWANKRLIAAIEGIDAKTSVKIKHDKELAVKNLYADYGRLEDAANSGNITAINARTAINRELDCINGLQKQTINTTSDEPAAVYSPELQADIDAAMNREALRKANIGGDLKIGS